jgi:hypothetical protein
MKLLDAKHQRRVHIKIQGIGKNGTETSNRVVVAGSSVEYITAIIKTALAAATPETDPTVTKQGGKV